MSRTAVKRTWGLYGKYLKFMPDFNQILIVFDRFRWKFQISDFIKKIRPLRADSDTGGREYAETPIETERGDLPSSDCLMQLGFCTDCRKRR